MLIEGFAYCDGCGAKIAWPPLNGENQIREYEMAWKQIEYYMKTSWTFFGLAVSSPVMGGVLLYLIRQKICYLVLAFALVLIAVCLLFLFFLRNRALARVQSVRMLEIEANFGLRANWRAHLSTGDLERNIGRWQQEKKLKLTKNEARKAVEETREDSHKTLLKIVEQEYADAERQIRKTPRGVWLIRLLFIDLVLLVILVFVSFTALF